MFFPPKVYFSDPVEKYVLNIAVVTLCILSCYIFPLITSLQIMFNLDRVHIILDEIIQNGHIVETNKSRILAPLTALDKMADGWRPPRWRRLILFVF